MKFSIVFLLAKLFKALGNLTYLMIVPHYSIYTMDEGITKFVNIKCDDVSVLVKAAPWDDINFGFTSALK